MATTRVTDEQIQEARNITLLSYLQSTNPGILRHKSGGRYVHKDHDSFVIDNGKGQWFWNSQSQKGHSSLDYLMRVEGMGFLDAVQSLTSGSMPTFHDTRPPPKSQGRKDYSLPRKTLTLPAPAENNDGIVAYLRKRGISEATTRKYISQGLLYESANNSCVFVGRDTGDGNKPKYAAERSITGDGKKDAVGSDKAFSFCLPPDKADSTTVAVFESGVDALSHHEIMAVSKAERSTEERNLNVQKAHVQHEMALNLLADFDGFRLSLAGTATIALTSFLERNPHVQNIYLCLDADPAGEKATERIIGELLSDDRFKDKNITVAPPPIGKDFNDTLLDIRRLVMERNNPERQQSKKPRKASHIKEMPLSKKER